MSTVGEPSLRRDLTEAAFLADILAHPDDDAPRLIFADWLDENGGPDRASFIRVQCEMARLPACRHRVPTANQESCRHCGLSCRAWDILFSDRRTNYWHAWAAPLPGLLGVGLDYGGTLQELPWVFRRGFVEAVTLTAELWLAHERDLRAAAPLREVTLTTPQPFGVLGGRLWIGDRLWPAIRFTFPH
jgi:uncharacterized protein (TIGR02996 family)